MVFYCYNYARLILDEIMKISANRGHQKNSSNALILHDVGIDWCLYLAEFVQK
jgi:hypothetical protein